MKIWILGKDVMLAVTLTMLYAIWSEEGLHEFSTLHMWLIIILVFALILHLIIYVNREVKRIQSERKRKRGKK